MDSRFYPNRLPIKVSVAAQITAATISDDSLGNSLIYNFSSIENCDRYSVCFLQNKKYLSQLNEGEAVAIFCDKDSAALLPKNICALICESPYDSFCTLIDFACNFNSLEHIHDVEDKVHNSSKIEPDALIAEAAYIGKNVIIGSGTVIEAGAVIKDNCIIGRNCLIASGAVVQFAMIGDNVKIHPGCAIGQDGFGYLISKDKIRKIPQIGRVIIQDDVEIGANTTIDRGSLGDTVIGLCTKIDNLVQIGHNVTIGSRCLIASQTGISGSVKIGDGVMMGGKVGIKDHVNIGNNVQIMAGSGVMNDIPDSEKWGGYPAKPVRQWMREVIALQLSASGSK